MSELGETVAVQAPPVDPFRYGWRMVWTRDEHGQLVQTQRPLTFEETLHPEEGDRVMSHLWHDADVSYLRDVLQEISDSREQTRVLREVRIDWGVPGLGAHLPDIAFFTDEQERETYSLGTYKPSEVGAKPLLVIEVTSPTTRGNDILTKVDHYHRAGVAFYAIVDYLPEANMAQAVVIGYRATPQGYLFLERDPRGRLWLEALGIWLGWEGGRVVCFDDKDRPIPSRSVLTKEKQEAEARSEEMSRLAEEAILVRQEAEKKSADLAALVAELQTRLAELGGSR